MTTTSTAPDRSRRSTATAAAPGLPRGRRSAAAAVVAVLLLLLAGYTAWQAILVQLGGQPYPL
ncbi:MAG TPA: hypothetical protein VIJ23_00655, partial [Mycobacterium sp.]